MFSNKICLRMGANNEKGLLSLSRAVGLNLSINCVYNQKGQVIRIISGSLEMAFAEAVGLCSKRLGHRLTEKVDVTISSSFPHTHGPQIMKGLSAPDVVTKETGAILLVAPAVAPLPPQFLTSIHVVKEKFRNKSVAYIKDTLSRGIAPLPDKAIDYNMAITSMFLRPKIRTILVSPSISRNEARSLGLSIQPPLRKGLGYWKDRTQTLGLRYFRQAGLLFPLLHGSTVVRETIKSGATRVRSH